MNIKINENEIELKYSFRSLMMFENINGSTYNGGSLNDAITLFYCVVLTSSKDYSLEFDTFIDWLDENQSALKEFCEWIATISNNQNKLKKD